MSAVSDKASLVRDRSSLTLPKYTQELDLDRIYEIFAASQDNDRLVLHEKKLSLAPAQSKAVTQQDKKVIKLVLNRLLAIPFNELDTVKIYGIIAKMRTPSYVKLVLDSSNKARLQLEQLEVLTKTKIQNEQNEILTKKRTLEIEPLITSAVALRESRLGKIFSQQGAKNDLRKIQLMELLFEMWPVENMADANILEKSNVITTTSLIHSYKNCASSAELISALCTLFQTSALVPYELEQLQAKLLSFCLEWLMSGMHDHDFQSGFFDGIIFPARASAFIDVRKLGEVLNSTLEQSLEIKKRSEKTPLPPLSFGGSDGIIFQEIKEKGFPIVFAETLAWDCMLFLRSLVLKIPVDELLKDWVKSPDRTPAITNISKYFNALVLFIVDQIVSDADINQRIGAYRFFVQMALRCIALGDYCTSYTIFSALNDSSVLRMENTQAAIGKEARKQLKLLQTLFSPERNHANLNTSLKQRQQDAKPYILVLPLFLQHLQFIKDSNPDIKLICEHPLYNVCKLNLIADQANALVKMQRALDSIEGATPKSDIRQWLQHKMAFSKKEEVKKEKEKQYRLSISNSPKNRRLSVIAEITDFIENLNETRNSTPPN